MKKILLCAILFILIVGCVPPGGTPSTPKTKQEEQIMPLEESQEPESSGGLEEPEVIIEPEEIEKQVSINVKLFLKSKYAQVEVDIDGEKESSILKTINEEEIIDEIATKYGIEKDLIKDNIEFEVEETLEEEPTVKEEGSRINQVIKTFESKVKSYRYVKEDLPFPQSIVYVYGNKVKYELKQPEGTEYFERRLYAREDKEEVRRKATEGEEYFVNLAFLDKGTRNAKGICTALDLYTSCEWIEGVVQKLPWDGFGLKLPGDWLYQFKNIEPTRVIEAGGFINGVDTHQLIFEQGDKTTRIWVHTSFAIPQQVEVDIGDSKTRIVYKDLVINAVAAEEVEDPLPYNPEDKK